MKSNESASSWEKLQYQREKLSSDEGMVSAARAGDSQAARDLIAMAAAFLFDPTMELPREVREYMCFALEDVAQGQDPRKALNLTGTARQSYLKLERDLELAKSVASEMQQGMTLDEACRHVDRTYRGLSKMAGGVGYEAVRKAYLKFKRESPG